MVLCESSGAKVQKVNLSTCVKQMKETNMLYQPLRITALLAMMLFFATGARAESFVAKPSDLPAVLRLAQGGDTILLQPGDYGSVDIEDLTPTAPITLRADGTGAPVRFAGLNLRNVANITLDGILFEYRFNAGDPLWTSRFSVNHSQKVTIRNSRFSGDIVRGGAAADEGYASGIGLKIDKSSDINVLDNQINTFYRGLLVAESDRVTISRNDVSAIRSDGMNFVAVQSLLVEDNYLRDFRASRASGDHPDMIQFWTTGTTRPTRDVTLRNNVLNSGKGSWTQSIFMGNELVSQGKAGDQMFYQNITITGNVIVNSHLHGITVGETNGLTISNNTLIHNRLTDGDTDNPTLWTPRINVMDRSENVSILRNLTPDISGPKNRPDWTVRDNFLTQDRNPSRSGFVGRIFTAGIAGDPGDLTSFTYLPDGPAGSGNLGAPRLLRP